MSLLGQLPNIIGGVTALVQARNATRGAAGATMPTGLQGLQLRALPAPSMPGAGQFRTGGGFPSSARMPGMRKRRRTNPTNVKALRRALSRVEGFIKIEKRVDKILRRVAPKARTAQRVGFVKRRR